MKFKAEPKDTTQYLPKSKYDLEDKYDELLKSCNEWDKVYFQKMFNSKNLRDIVNDENFQKIYSIYNERKLEEKQSSVTNFLLDLINLGQSEFIIPYAFITGEVPESYDRIHLGMIGISKSLPDMFEHLDS
jgi:hypothetical protein